MKRVWAATLACVAGLTALAPAATAQAPDVPAVGGGIEDFGQWRSPYFFYRMDRSTQMELPDLDVAAAIAESQRALLVVNFYYDGGRYSNYQQALLRRILFYLSTRMPGLEVRLLDVMVASSDGRAIYENELSRYYANNTLGQYGATIQGKPVMPYGQVYLGGRMVYDFSVMWEARDDNQVMENARAIQSSMLRIAADANSLAPPPETPEEPQTREPDLPPETFADRPGDAPPPAEAPAPAMREPAPPPALPAAEAEALARAKALERQPAYAGRPAEASPAPPVTLPAIQPESDESQPVMPAEDTPPPADAETVRTPDGLPVEQLGL